MAASAYPKHLLLRRHSLRKICGLLDHILGLLDGLLNLLNLLEDRLVGLLGRLSEIPVK